MRPARGGRTLRPVSDSRACIRPRFLLALLLALLVAEAVPAPAARRDKGSAAAAWRAAVRPAEQDGDPGPRGNPSFLFAAVPPPPLALPHAADAEADAAQTPRHRPAAAASARRPLPRAPPLA